MELSRRTIQRMILRKSGDTTVINQGSEGGGGGSQPSVALGPLLTSLNSEAMPTAEGYLHWNGSAWAFDTPTGGDPVDLTPYALKTWVQDNFAYKNDLVNFITRTEAESEFAPISHTHDNYLPLSAGANKALTGSLYITGSNGIQWAGSPGVGMLCYMPSSGWTGINASQWGVGAPSAQGVIRTNANDILHYRNGTNYKIWDAYNFTPSDYLPLTGGTVESLTVTNGLDADSITVGSIVNSDTLAEYLDQDASDARYLQLTGGTLTGNLIMNGAGVGFGPNGNYGYIDYSNSQLRIGSGTVHVQSDGLFLFNGDQVATQPWVTAQLGNYLPLAGGTVSGNLTMIGGGIYFKRTSGGNVDGAILASTVTPQGYQSAVGCITIGGAVNFDNDGAPPMAAGKWLATQEWVGQQGFITQTAADGRYIKGVSVYGSSLNPDTNRVVNIPYADINTPGVIQIGTGLVNSSDDHTEVDTSVIASKSWANGQFVTVLGVSGEYLTYTKNGSTTNLTVRFAMRTMGFKRMYVTGSQIADANTMTVGGVEYALLSNYASTDLWANMPSGMSWGNVLQLTSASSLSGQLAWDSNDGVTTGVTRKLYWRSRNNLGWGTDDWHTIAFQDWVQSWVNGRGFASAQDLYDLGTLVTTGYLPLTAGSGKSLTGSLYVTPGAGTHQTVEIRGSQYYIGLAIGAGDVNRGLWQTIGGSGSWLLYFDASNTILNYGNVGIGTTTPTAKLDVNGNMRIAGALYGAGGYIDLQYSDEINRYGGNLYLQHRGGGITGTGTGSGNTGNLIMCAHGGNVGIGTSSPDSILHVVNECHFAGGAKFNNICIEVNNSIAASGRGSEINNYNGKLLLQYNSSTNCSICYGGGNVGIGTTEPVYKLDVSGVIRATDGIMVRSGSSDAIGFDTTGILFNKAQEGGSPITASIFAFTWDNDAQNVIVSKNGNMTVTGKLAVGTTTFDGSNAKLQVGGNMFATGSITSKSNAGNVSLGNGNISATNLYISTVVFGNSNNDPAIYIGNGHVYARNSQGQTTMIV